MVNKTKLFLSGGGSTLDSLNVDKAFASSLDKSRPLLYIPIAMDTSKVPYSNCFNWIKSVFEPLGVKNITMWVEKDLRNKKFNDFLNFSGVYIGGGNTFNLLKKLKDLKTFDILKKLAKAGVPISGGSAGAILLGRDIITANDPNELKIRDTRGLDLLQGYSIICHYEKKEKEFLLNLSKKGLKLIALRENAGIFFNGEKIEDLGISSAELDIF